MSEAGPGGTGIGLTVLDLPQETLDRIIDNLSEDQQALKACSLTSRYLLDRSCKWLHHRCRIVDVEQSDRYHSYYTSPHIAQHVRKLTLETMINPLSASQSDQSENARRTADASAALARRLTGVNELIFDDCLWEEFDNQDKEQYLRSFSAVTSLKLIDCTFQHREYLLHLLSAFSRVTRIDFIAVDLWNMDQEVSYPRPPDLPGRHLDYLSIRDFAPRKYTGHAQVKYLVDEWLSIVAPVLSPGITFQWDMFIAQRALPDILQSIGLSITNIELALYSKGLAHSIPSEPTTPFVMLNRVANFSVSGPMGIQRCVSLENLTLDKLCKKYSSHDGSRYYRTSADPSYVWVMNLLSEVTSSRLKTVTLCFTAKAISDFYDFDFPGVDAYLAHHPKFQGLCKVFILLRRSPHDELEDVEQRLRGAFPNLAERKLLQLDLGESSML